MAFGKWAVGFGNGLWLANRYWPGKGHCRPPQDVLQVYRGEVEAFPLQRDAARKKNVLVAWEASLKPGRSCGVRERAPRKDHHRPPHKGHHRPPCKGKVLMLRTVQFVGLRLSTGLS